MYESLDDIVTIIWKVVGILGTVTLGGVAIYGAFAWKRQDNHRQALSSLRELRRLMTELLSFGIDLIPAATREIGSNMIASQKRVVAIDQAHEKGELSNNEYEIEGKAVVNAFLAFMASFFADAKMRLSEITRNIENEVHSLRLLGMLSEADERSVKAITERSNNWLKGLELRISALTKGKRLLDTKFTNISELYEAIDALRWSKTTLGSNSTIQEAHESAMAAVNAALELIYDEQSSNRWKRRIKKLRQRKG